jgi:hypothetical protein
LDTLAGTTNVFRRRLVWLAQRAFVFVSWIHCLHPFFAIFLPTLENVEGRPNIIEESAAKFVPEYAVLP